MKANLIEQAYAVAKERYAAIGVDTDAVLDQLQKQQLSLSRAVSRPPVTTPAAPAPSTRCARTLSSSRPSSAATTV